MLSQTRLSVFFCEVNMTRLDTFTFRLNGDEREFFAALRKRLARSQLEAVRFVVVSAAHELKQTPEPTKTAPTAQSVKNNVTK